MALQNYHTPRPSGSEEYPVAPKLHRQMGGLMAYLFAMASRYLELPDTYFYNRILPIATFLNTPADNALIR